MFKRLRSYFIRGVFLLLPVVLTYFLCWQFYQMLDSWVLAFIHKLLGLVNIQAPPLMDLLLLLSFITLVGFLGGNWLGKKFIHLSEQLINRIPLVRSIYNALRQILESIKKGKAKSSFQVVQVEYPRRGIYSLGFVTAKNKDPGGRKADLSSVLIPTSPNPTTGFLIFIPPDEILPTDLNVEDAVKLIMSAGVLEENRAKVEEASI